MPISFDATRSIPLRSAESIEIRARQLIGRALTRKVWLLLVDESDLQLPVLIPIEQLPARPPDDARCSLQAFLAELVSEPVHGVVTVLERPGSPGLNDSDRAWLLALHTAMTNAGASPRGFVLSHSRGVRWLPADDWL